MELQKIWKKKVWKIQKIRKIDFAYVLDNAKRKFGRFWRWGERGGDACHSQGLPFSKPLGLCTQYSTRLEKIASVVRETCVPRHNGGPIKKLPETSQRDRVL